MILKEITCFESAEDYASWRGFYDSALGCLDPNLFQSSLGTAKALRAIYELAFETEEQENILTITSEHNSVSIVVEWDDLHGMGYLIVPQCLRKVFFSYNSFENIDDNVSKGDRVVVRYKFDDPDIKVIKVCKTNQP